MQNQGACGFFQWVDTNTRDGCKSKGFSALQSRHSLTNNDLDNKETILELNVESLLPQNAENSPDPPIITEQSVQDDIPCMDRVVQEVESLDPMTENPIQVFQPTAQLQSPYLKE